MSGHRFAVGEICEVRCLDRDSWYPCEILVTPAEHWQTLGWKTLAPYSYGILVEGSVFAAQEGNLRKLPGADDDSRQVTSWDKCLFKPKGVKYAVQNP